jgi:peptidoglycan-N-acetylglucosamine deacetylase
MMGDDYLPYRARRGDVITLEQPAVFGAETSLVEMPISWTLDDYPHFEFVRTGSTILGGLKPAGGVLENWYDDYDYMTRILDWGIITYTCHPFVIGRGHRMLMLERLVEKLRARGAVFLMMEDAVREWQGRRAG